MSAGRKYVLSIAGFDPSGGAGLIADVKTFEQHKVYGLSINTSNTIQTVSRFYSAKWMDLHDILQTLDVMLGEFPVKVIKTGIVPSFEFLYKVIEHIRNKSAEIKIVVDPVLRSSTGFEFHEQKDKKMLKDILKNIFLITPNVQEAIILGGDKEPKQAAKNLVMHCNVLLKGGHNDIARGVDYLFTGNECHELHPGTGMMNEKHGSGCVLSAAITANLALDNDLKSACINAKKYVEQFLNSNNTLLGYHNL